MGIKVEEIEKGERRKVLEDFEDQYGIIPKDFEFDGASVPRIFHRIVAQFKYLWLSARHDADCEQARHYMAKSVKFSKDGFPSLSKVWEELALKTRRKADKRYREGLIEVEGKAIGWLAWAGVRTGSFFKVGWN